MAKHFLTPPPSGPPPPPTPRGLVSRTEAPPWSQAPGSEQATPALRGLTPPPPQKRLLGRHCWHWQQSCPWGQRSATLCPPHCTVGACGPECPRAPVGRARIASSCTGTPSGGSPLPPAPGMLTPALPTVVFLSPTNFLVSQTQVLRHPLEYLIGLCPLE